jgi:hypothetical protein
MHNESTRLPAGQFHNFLFAFMIVTILGGVLLAFSNPGHSPARKSGFASAAIVRGISR